MITYDRVLKEYLPSFRCEAALLMKERYNMGQERIAEVLGVSQAEVSKYLAGLRPKNKIKIDNDVVRRFVESEIKGRKVDAQRAACSGCPKGAEATCLIMVK
jgi:Predicted transcriptional regulator